jgi:hypothetical protein
MHMKTSLVKVLLLSPLLCWLIASCGGAAGGGALNFDSNTNWLKKCDFDSDCDGVLRCLCGICSQPCGTVAECSRLSGAACAESASDECSGESSAGALCVLACTGDAECGAGFECRSAQCVPIPASVPAPEPEPDPAPPTASCEINWDRLYEAIEADILGQDAEDRPFVRYVTLANRLNAGQCGAALLDDRLLLRSVLSSLATQGSAGQAALILGGTETVRIDLRDYGLSDIEGPVIANGNSFVDAWEAIISNTKYAVEFQGDQAENVILLTNTVSPVLFFDAVVDGASAAGLPLNDPAFMEVALRSFDLDVDLATAAGDLLYPPDLLVNEIIRLDPAVSGLDQGFRIDRDDWGFLYVNSLCIVSPANENRPTDERCIDAGAPP